MATHPPRPHDLVHIAGTQIFAPDAPPWVHAALHRTPWAVVRRATAPTGRIAIGVRGATRSERYAAEVDRADVHGVVTPEDLSPVNPRSDRELPAFHALRLVRPLIEETALAWGPTGSVGFELASGTDTVTSGSDLDILIRLPGGSLAQSDLLSALHRDLCALAVRVDCQVETCGGAVALAELVSSHAEILVRTPEGPRLITRTVAVT